MFDHRSHSLQVLNFAPTTKPLAYPPSQGLCHLYIPVYFTHRLLALHCDVTRRDAYYRFVAFLWRWCNTLVGLQESHFSYPKEWFVSIIKISNGYGWATTILTVKLGIFIWGIKINIYGTSIEAWKPETPACSFCTPSRFRLTFWN